MLLLQNPIFADPKPEDVREPFPAMRPNCASDGRSEQSEERSSAEDRLFELAEQLRRALAKDDDPNLPYIPYLRAVHSGSRGYAQRVPGSITNRIHDLLSRHEFHALLLFEWSEANYRNIREQFPLPLELTQELARRANVNHPWNRFTKQDAVMSVDFVLTKPDGSWEAVDFKQSSEVGRKRTAEKLQLTKTAFELVGVPHFSISETDLPKTMIRNYRFLRSMSLPFDPPPLSENELSNAKSHLQKSLIDGRTTIFDAAVAVSPIVDISPARLARGCYWLVANRHWVVDLTVEIGPDFTLRFIHQ